MSEKEFKELWKKEQKQHWTKKSLEAKLEYITSLQQEIQTTPVTSTNEQDVKANIYFLGKAQYNINTKPLLGKFVGLTIAHERINYWQGQTFANFDSKVLKKSPENLQTYINRKSGESSPFTQAQAVTGGGVSPTTTEATQSTVVADEDQNLDGLLTPLTPGTLDEEYDESAALAEQAGLDEYIEERENKLTSGNQKRILKLVADFPPDIPEAVDELVRQLPKTEDGNLAEPRIPDEGEGLIVLDVGDGEDAVKAVADAMEDMITQTVTEQEPARLAENENGVRGQTQWGEGQTQPVVANNEQNMPQDASFEQGVLNQVSNTYSGGPGPTVEIEQDAGTRGGGGGTQMKEVLANLDKGVTSAFAEKRKEGMSIAKLKDDIKSFHKIFDGLIPLFKSAEHQAKFKKAIRSSNKREILSHFEEMETAIANYYKDDSGFKLGVIISAESLFSGGLQNLQALGAVNSVGGKVKDTSSFERGGVNAYEGVADVEPTFTRGGIDHALQKPVANRMIKGKKREKRVDKNVKTIPTQVFSQYNHLLNRKLNPVADFKIKTSKRAF